MSPSARRTPGTRLGTRGGGRTAGRRRGASGPSRRPGCAKRSGSPSHSILTAHRDHGISEPAAGASPIEWSRTASIGSGRGPVPARRHVRRRAHAARATSMRGLVALPGGERAPRANSAPRPSTASARTPKERGQARRSRAWRGPRPRAGRRAGPGRSAASRSRRRPPPRAVSGMRSCAAVASSPQAKRKPPSPDTLTRRPAAGQRRPEALREGAAERAPAERVRELARRGGGCGSRRASSRGCTCRRPRSRPAEARRRAPPGTRPPPDRCPRGAADAVAPSAPRRPARSSRPGRSGHRAGQRAPPSARRRASSTRSGG